VKQDKFTWPCLADPSEETGVDGLSFATIAAGFGDADEPGFFSFLGGLRIKALFGLFIGQFTANIMVLGLAIATKPCHAALGILRSRTPRLSYFDAAQPLTDEGFKIMGLVGRR
jgi:hypothetical protein